MTEDLKEKILHALKEIKLSGMSQNIVELNLVSGINIKNGNVQFSIELDEKYKNHASEIIKKSQKIVMNIPGVNSAIAIPTAHKNFTRLKQEDSSTNNEKNIQGINKIIAVASGKGGVGKSTTAINLAISIKNNGYNVGILDADIYGPSLPKLIGSNQKPESDGKKLKPINAFGLQVMSIGFLVPDDSPTIWRGPMVISALTQLLTQVSWENIDFLIIDLPPGTGDIQLSLSQKANLSGTIIVSTPQDLALIDARKGLNMFRKVDVPVLGIIENMSFFICPSCNEQTNIFGNGGAKKEAENLGVEFLGAIPLDSEIRSTSDEGIPITEKNSKSPQSKIYNNIAKTIISKVYKIKNSAPKIIFD